jgi:GNAT superfamily N-acetyltransferase
MHEELAEIRLKTGEMLRVVVVEAPDEEHAGTVLSLLKHKGELRQWQFQEDFAGRAAGVRSRYYLGFLDGRAVANVSVWETGPVGDLGHVFTAESHRRKGICQAVMATQMEDFRRRGGELLVLGTRYDGHPYRIYQSFGFQSMTAGSGAMRFQPDPAFDARLFAAAPVSLGAVAWGDLGLVCGLMACPDGNWVRSTRARTFGPSSTTCGSRSWATGRYGWPAPARAPSSATRSSDPILPGAASAGCWTCSSTPRSRTAPHRYWES